MIALKMRWHFLPFLSLALIAASPASDEARQLMDAGQDARAFALVEAAATSGDDDALDYLAWFYDTGRFVAQDRPRAARLYRQAAERGQRHAQWRLGVMLDLGEGVAEDPVEAFQWISRAAAQGSPRATVSMGVMYATGRGVGRDYAQSRRYYLAAARMGEAHGFYGVGVLYSLGQGVEADQQEALAWMMCAASLGDEDARRAAERFHLDSAAMTAAADRANAIFAEFGITGHRVQFRDFDAERGQPVT